MQRLNARDLYSFKALAQMSQPKLLNTVYEMLKNMYPEGKVTKTVHAVCAEGEIPICLVAHLDTVFEHPPTEIYYDKEANVMWSPDGLGADDRAGVFAIFKILSAGHLPHVVFTTDEERGAIGASNLVQEPCPFKELDYIIELDRANAIDCVFYEGANYEFEDYIESFGFVTARGTFTDIVELCPAWGVSGVNLSIGYRDEHSISEVLFVGQMLATIEKVKKMLLAPDRKKFPFISQYGYGGICKCHGCGKVGASYLMVPVTIDKLNHKVWLCGDCVAKEDVEWCDSCYEGFLPGLLNKDGLCPECERLELNGFSKGLFRNTGSVQSGDFMESGVYPFDDYDYDDF